ncbi:NUDIX domain-containing protein [Nocardia sp. ET3-3]|uniref:NUDIX domain-containing protein n=1 Tax=Nocardia terrae TaxID=2675851 RepID=A0A7K1V323_9NOCA|nr:NUDIX domain-containing protein [Nocardia terrae]
MEEKHLVYCRIARAGTVLVIRRAPGVFLAGRWELPGGGVEPGEPHEEAAVREVGEETGLSVEVVGQRSAHSWMDVAGREMRIHATVYDVAEREMRTVALNPDEHDEHRWVTPEQAAALDLADHFRAALSNQ